MPNQSGLLILELSKGEDQKELDRLVEAGATSHDSLDLLLDELYEIRFPSDHIKDKETITKFKKETAPDLKSWGSWVYYPWSKKLVHFPPEEVWEEVRTARNKTLITAEEQEKFWNYKLGIVGLSVGQSAALTIVRSGGCKNLKLADPDTLAPTNLNRLQGDLSDCGVKKIDLVSRRILELDPYYNLQLYQEGLTQENIEDFFTEDFKLDAIIDACDNIPIKIAIRLAARKHRIPVLMATDLGNGVLADVERYDLEPSKAIFGGRIDENQKIESKKDFIREGLKIISPEFVTLPLNEAMMQIGRSIPTHPQLGSSALFGGVVLSYLIRKLSISSVFPSERTHIDLDSYFDEWVKTEDYKAKKKTAISELKKLFEIT